MGDHHEPRDTHHAPGGGGAVSYTHLDVYKRQVMGRSGIRAAYATGRGRITVRARAEIEENEKTGRSKIIVTELPYQVNKARLIESIADLVKEKRIEGISNIDDHSDRNGMHIVIDVDVYKRQIPL